MDQSLLTKDDQVTTMDDTYYKQIELFDQRLSSLERHYDNIKSDNIKIDKELERSLGFKTQVGERLRKRYDEVDERYSAKIKELKAHFELLEQMYKAKEEEYRYLKDYLENNELEKLTKNSSGQQCSSKNLAIFKQLDIDSLRAKNKVFQDKYNKLKLVNEQISRDLDKLSRTMKYSRDSVNAAKKIRDAFLKTKSTQESSIERIQRETRQLNLVISQYSSTDCKNDLTMIGNLRAKCNFISSDNNEFTLSTLKKHHQKQRKIIELLTHKQKMNERHNSILTVETESVKGLMNYYACVINKAHQNQYIDVEILS